MTKSSFYSDGEVYDTAEVVSNDVSASTATTKAPSGFYPNGGVYDALTEESQVIAEMTAIENATVAAGAAAAVSASNAATSAAKALTSETHAASSDADATAQAGIATTQAGIATTKAANALTSETNAAGSATTATTQAGIATTKAGQAATSATNAGTSETNAAASAAAALASKNAAATSETNAGTSATNAATSATNAASAVQAAAGTATPLINAATAVVGSGTKWAREDHVHPTDTTRAPLNNAGLTGSPTAPTPTAGDNSTKIATTAFVLANAGSGVGDNVLINGDFRVNQGGYVSSAVLAAGAYGHDQWKAGASGGDYSFTQLKSSTQITIATGKSLIQPIEDANVAGGSYVLSWTGTAQARAGVNTLTPSGSYASSPLLISGQTAATVMSVEFNAGTLGTVKLERGSAATAFVMRPLSRELELCKRYWWHWKEANSSVIAYGGPIVSATRMIAMVTYPVEMRTNPSYTCVNPGSALLNDGAGGFGTCTGSALSGTSGTQTAAVAFDASAAAFTSGRMSYILSNNTNFEMQFNARL